MSSSTKVIAVAGIDTDVGKSVVTGLLARYLHERRGGATTVKLVQTGCTEVSDDILLHRRLMNIPLADYDRQGTSCPYLFPFPASPRLAARMQGKTIDTAVLDQATASLAADHEWILVEGAGGLLVPLNETTLLIDYFKEKHYPVVLVTSSKLGSINHTRLSLEALKSRNIPVLGLVYNLYSPSEPPIVQDTLLECRRALSDYEMHAPLIVLPDTGETLAINWEPLLKQFS